MRDWKKRLSFVYNFLCLSPCLPISYAHVPTARLPAICVVVPVHVPIWLAVFPCTGHVLPWGRADRQNEGYASLCLIYPTDIRGRTISPCPICHIYCAWQFYRSSNICQVFADWIGNGAGDWFFPTSSMFPPDCQKAVQGLAWSEQCRESSFWSRSFSMCQ